MAATTTTAYNTAKTIDQNSTSKNISVISFTDVDQTTNVFKLSTSLGIVFTLPSPAPPSSTGAIAGGLIGGIVAIGLIFLGIILWRRKLSPKDAATPQTPADPDGRISMPSNPSANAPSTLPDASSGYDSVVPTATQGNYYKDHKYNGRSSLQPGLPDDDDDANAVYVNAPASPYVNFTSRDPRYIDHLNPENNFDDNEEHYYGNLPHPSRTPSAKRPVEEEEDEYLPMDGFRN